METNRIDGRQIAARIRAALSEEIHTLPHVPKMRVMLVGTDPATESFVRIKERCAVEAGIVFSVERFPEETSTETLKAALRTGDEDALVVQLPLPAHVDTDAVLALIPPEKDADVLSPVTYAQFEAGEDCALVPPVACAVREVLADGDFSPKGCRAVVVGNGRLVGKPTARWLMREGALVEVITRTSGALSYALTRADLVVSGAGVPHLIKRDFIKEGVALIDAGTSEAGGVIVGDIDPACAGKSTLYTPVPGGIGPITIAALLKNVVELTKRRCA